MTAFHCIGFEPGDLTAGTRRRKGYAAAGVLKFSAPAPPRRRSDFQYLKRQLVETGTPEGESLARHRRGLVDLCKPLIAPAGRTGRRDGKHEGTAP